MQLIRTAILGALACIASTSMQHAFARSTSGQEEHYQGILAAAAPCGCRIGAFGGMRSEIPVG